ncbi:glycosyltransferase [Psychrosphaera aestuarii]|uniref:glycosyltransferase n=1 Tax=Psychrosphaera aestuarii TaxID=1266052 RepID=UPI001B33AD1D|nr:glycosyltransferase [Psychrosphaera aestuarii]
MNKVAINSCLNRKKVVHIVPSFGCGGLEKVVVNLINNSEHYNVKHVLISLTTDFELAKEIDVPVEVYCLGKQPGNDILSHVKLFRLLKRIKPTAFHTYNFGTIEYHLVAKLAGVPVTVHCDHGRGGDDPAGKNKFNNRFRQLISKFIDHYIVVSYDLYRWVTETLKISESKVQLIFNGVTVEKYVAENHASDTPASSNPPFMITTVGRLDPIKNQKLLLSAFDLAKKTYPNWENVKLQLAGNGPIYQELVDFKDKLASADDIDFLGFRSDIPDILKATDLFALSSNYEAMPMTILEAMALKRPVITTNVGGIAKFISEQHAWFVESKNVEQYAETLNEIKLDQTAREQKIETAHQLVYDNYSMDKMVDAYLGLYQIETA